MPAEGTVTTISTDRMYQYTSIQSKNEVRVLEVFSARPERSLHLEGSLVTVRLEDKPDFEALSYAWDQPMLNQKLQLTTGCLFITENLAAGLRQMRFSDQPRRLWIDVVCINQKDSTEKGHQVMLMSKVYREAKCVLVWLGIGNEHTDAIMSRMNQIWKTPKPMV